MVFPLFVIYKILNLFHMSVNDATLKQNFLGVELIFPGKWKHLQTSKYVQQKDPIFDIGKSYQITCYQSINTFRASFSLSFKSLRFSVLEKEDRITSQTYVKLHLSNSQAGHLSNSLQSAVH